MMNVSSSVNVSPWVGWFRTSVWIDFVMTILEGPGAVLFWEASDSGQSMWNANGTGSSEF